MYRQAVDHKRDRDRPGDLAMSLGARGVALVADGHADQAVPVLEEAVTLVKDLNDYNLTLTKALAALAAAHGDLDQPDDRDRVLEQLNDDGVPTDVACAPDDRSVRRPA